MLAAGIEFADSVPKTGFAFLPSSPPEGAAASPAPVLEPGVCSELLPVAELPVPAPGWGGKGPLAWTERGGSEGGMRCSEPQLRRRASAHEGPLVGWHCHQTQPPPAHVNFLQLKLPEFYSGQKT